MKRLNFALLLAALVACGGGGGSDPVKPSTPTKSPMQVENGSFVVTATVSFDGCAVRTPWSGNYDVAIDSTAFSMGPFTGKWDAKSAAAEGETEKMVSSTRGCTSTIYSSIYITFTNPNHFAGTLIYKERLTGSCGTRAGCTSSWIVRGDRAPTP